MSASARFVLLLLALPIDPSELAIIHPAAAVVRTVDRTSPVLQTDTDTGEPVGLKPTEIVSASFCRLPLSHASVTVVEPL